MSLLGSEYRSVSLPDDPPHGPLDASPVRRAASCRSDVSGLPSRRRRRVTATAVTALATPPPHER